MNGITNQGSKQTLSPTTPEFGYLEYNLQLALRSCTARITSAYVISNPHLSVQYERKCQDMLSLSSWVESSSLTGVNTEEEIIRRGFQFPAGGVHGMMFPVGSIKNNTETRIVRKVLFCKIGCGRAYASESSRAEKEVIPDGYDSLYLRDTSIQHSDKQGDYYHEYYIKNQAQVLPQYIVNYEYDPVQERKSREAANCDNCDLPTTATVYCASDAANLCKVCDKKLHETKVASRHIRTPIGKGADIFGHCRHHSKKMIEFFCSQCHIPVCVNCKMVGNHANGEAAKHQLVSVAEAYHTVMQEAQIVDPLLQSRKVEINNQINSVNSRAKAVEKMGHQLQAQIDEIHRRATEDLKFVIRKKMDVLMGDELELKRQLGESERVEEFLNYQQNGDPTHFLFSWSRHQKLRSELHDFKFFRNEIDVYLDVKVNGGVSVVIDRAPSPQNVNQHQMMIKKHQQQQQLQQQQQKNSVAASATKPPMAVLGPGVNMPKKLQDRRVQRRTSDFFAETLGAFDNFSAATEEIDDGFSDVSSRAQSPHSPIRV